MKGNKELMLGIRFGRVTIIAYKCQRKRNKIEREII